MYRYHCKCCSRRSDLQQLGHLPPSQHALFPCTARSPTLISHLQRGSKPTRASARLQGSKPEYAELVDHDERPYEALVDLLDDDTPIQEMNEEQRTELQERRCGSQGRGSIYDSSLGGCHWPGTVCMCFDQVE